MFIKINYYYLLYNITSFLLGYSGWVPYTSFIDGNNDSKDVNSEFSFEIMNWESLLCWWFSSSSELESSLELWKYRALELTNLKNYLFDFYITLHLTSYCWYYFAQSLKDFSYLNFYYQFLLFFYLVVFVLQMD